MHIQMDFFKELHVEGQTSYEVGKFPQIYGPLFTNSHICLQKHFMDNSEQIIKLVHKYGAVLFRGFDIKAPNQAVSVLNKLGLKSFQYVGGAAVRKLIIGSQDKSKINKQTVQMFTTNQAPPNQPIPFHNELLQNLNYPEFISFYCASQPETGGSTPIVNGHQLYKFLMKCHNDFLIKLQELGVKYSRIVGQYDNPNSPIGRGWRNIFNVQTKEEAQKKMKQAKYQFQWINNQDNDCRLTSQKLDAVIDSKNGLRTFCNQILAVFQGWKDNKNKPQDCLKFGDGSEMPQDMLKYLYQHAQNIKVAIPWKKGDLIILDNQLVMHSRQPFTGPNRKIYATLLKGKAAKDPQLCQILNSGYQMPLIGFGTWKIPKKQCSQVVYQAIKTGYRLLDCACDYGNEIQVGQGIIKAMDAKIIERKDLFITSKLWNTYHHPQHVRAACQRTLKDLKVDYLDLYLIHFPISLKYVPFDVRYPPQWRYDDKSQKPYMIEEPVPIIDTWRAMQQLVKDGLVRNIGISNFKVSLIRDLLYGCSIKPSVLQVQLHPQLTQKKLIRYCRQNGIQVTSYSTFGATSYVQLGGATSEEALTKNWLILQLAQKYQKSPHQIILRWAIQQGLAIIPKSSNQERMKQNFNITNFTLDTQDMISIDELNKNRRYNDPGVFCQLAFGTFFPIHD